MRPNVRTNDVTRLCLLTKVNDEYYSQITSGHHFRVCVYMNSNVITLWSNQCMPHSHAILYWNNNKTRPSLVHSRETINTGPTTVMVWACKEARPIIRRKKDPRDGTTWEKKKRKTEAEMDGLCQPRHEGHRINTVYFIHISTQTRIVFWAAF